MMIFDPWTYRMDTLTSKNGRLFKRSVVWVDLLMLVTNLVTMLFFMLNKLLMSNRTIIYFMQLNFLMMIITSMSAILIDDAHLDLSPQHGLFGWLESK